MDFLLECIGFPPTQDLAELATIVRERGEQVAWRGPDGEHLRLPVGDGLEVRLDRDEGELALWPYYDVERRLRLAFESKTALPDSPYDLLLFGIANPPLPVDGVDDEVEFDYPLVTYVSDARRLPRKIAPGHVLAVSICGFALDIDYLGPNEGGQDPLVLEEPNGALLTPHDGGDAPGGCMHVSARIREVRHLANTLTGETVQLVEIDAPGRPLDLFVSRWQLEAEGLEAPRADWRIEGSFLFSGRISGGLPATRRR